MRDMVVYQEIIELSTYINICYNFLNMLEHTSIEAYMIEFQSFISRKREKVLHSLEYHLRQQNISLD